MPETGGSVARWRSRVDALLERSLPAADASPARLHAAMRHAVLDGGKRMRPLLVYATGTAFGTDETLLDAPAAAVELVHAYSLVHDDLPAMDDDALRRGKPTVHVAFGEAIAILAGDALQSLAFELLVDAAVAAEVRVDALRELAVAAGVRGMCGGQALDLEATAPRAPAHANPTGAPPRAAESRLPDAARPGIDVAYIERLHALKTGALLRASVRMGARFSGVDADIATRLDAFADALGLAFQIQDDLLDIEGDSATLGKTAGKDQAQAKATFPALLGVDGSRRRLRQLADEMDAALAPFGPSTAMLAVLGRQAIDRIR
jgi:farnesyl diphosphate synthase